MRHGKDEKKFGRNSSHNRAMFRNMVTSLFKSEKITTTEAKAKQLRRISDRMITLAKKAHGLGDSADKDIVARKLHLRRQALSYIREKAVVAKLFDELAERFVDRPGGYTRVVKLGVRRGDAAAMAVVELVTEAVEEKKPKKKRSSRAKPKKAAAKAPAKEAAEKPEAKPETKPEAKPEVEVPEQEQAAEAKAEAEPEAEPEAAESEQPEEEQSETEQPEAVEEEPETAEDTGGEKPEDEKE